MFVRRVYSLAKWARAWPLTPHPEPGALNKAYHLFPSFLLPRSFRRMAANHNSTDADIEAELNKRQEEAEALGIEFDRLAVKRRIEQERKVSF